MNEIIDMMTIKVNNNTVSLRNVEEKDWKFILDLRNEEDIRLVCNDTSIIDFDTHRKYMKMLQEDKDSFQWLITFNDQDVGHIKVDRGMFGYMLKTNFRGKGIIKIASDIAFNELRKMGVKRLKGSVRIGEYIQLDVAKKMGFMQTEIITKEGNPYLIMMEKIL